MAKNNLGIIYKNGEGCKQNIYQAIEYFEEAIRQKNDQFSRYNLSRIYYFGIGIDKNIEKSFKLIKENNENNYISQDLFLFYLYLYVDKSLIDQEKVAYLLDQLSLLLDDINGFLSTKFNENEIDFIFKERYENFLKNHDLLYVLINDDSYDDLICDQFYHFMTEGSFFDLFIQRDSIKKTKFSTPRNINNNFYEGFYS